METTLTPQSFSVLLQLRVNSTATALAVGLPGDNHIATLILANAIQQALETDQETDIAANGSGPFNASLYCFVVPEVHPALAIIQRKLEEFCIFQFATIHWFDEREMFMRPMCHGQGVNPQEPLDLSKIAAENEANLQNAQARLEQFRASLPKAPLAPDQQ